ncbi:MAG: NAD(P)H-hydrate dehydratase [Bacteroidia bacterium]
MRILTTKQVRLSDAFTIKNGISSYELMERAAHKCYEFISDFLQEDSSVLVLAGNGNNGGDGWAIARMLLDAGFNVKVVFLNGDDLSEDNRINKDRFLEIGGECEMYLEREQPFEADVIIDSLFGSGLSRVLEGDLKDVVDLINHSKSLVFSIDSPSGFFTDEPMPEKALAVEASYTLCFHSPRLMFFFPESQRYLGNWEVLDIGLIQPDDKDFIKDSLPYSLSLVEELKGRIQPRSPFAHKGNFGHALLIGGSEGKYGAMILAAKACVRSGAGLTTLLLPSQAMNIAQISVPEAMLILSDGEKHISGNLNLELASSIGFGPGAGFHDDTAKTLKGVIQQGISKLVIDADGLNILSENKTWLAFLPPGTILTPHPGEMDRLTDKSDSSFERLQNARKLSRKFSVVVVLKGAYTAVCFPSGEVHFNVTGNPGMAKGGSGDALTGIITALLAQGYPNTEAAILGVALHGLAGDIASFQIGEESMLPSDLIEKLGEAFEMLK